MGWNETTDRLEARPLLQRNLTVEPSLVEQVLDININVSSRSFGVSHWFTAIKKVANSEPNTCMITTDIAKLAVSILILLSYTTKPTLFLSYTITHGTRRKFAIHYYYHIATTTPELLCMYPHTIAYAISSKSY